MKRKTKSIKFLKATIASIIVAFVFAFIVICIVGCVLKSEINTVVSLINMITVEEKELVVNKVQLDKNSDGTVKVLNYPSYGQNYATLSIEKAKINLPIYYGDSYKILTKGVGHSTGSYLPGENGTIVFGAHNSKDKFRNLSEVEIGDIITISVEYGVYKYKVEETEIINENNIEKLFANKGKEELILYTCYPFNAIGYTTKRYLVKAVLVDIGGANI